MVWTQFLIGVLLLMLFGLLVMIGYPVVQREMAAQAYCVDHNPGYECVKGWVPGRKISE